MKLLLGLLLILLIPILLILIAWKLLKAKKKSLRYFSLIPISIFLYLAVSVYFAIYPKDEFYKREWTRNTKMELPSSARVIQKNASYPDFHGDYCAVALIDLSPADFQNLKKEVMNSEKMRIDTTEYSIGRSHSFRKAQPEISLDELDEVFDFEHKDRFKVGFFRDGRRIVFEKISS